MEKELVLKVMKEAGKLHLRSGMQLFFIKKSGI